MAPLLGGHIESELENQVVAEQILNRAAVMWKGAPETTDPRLTPAILELAGWLAEQQRCVDAAPLLQRAAQLELDRQTPSTQLAELEGLAAKCAKEQSATVAAEPLG